jgi:hypothetical protein
LVPFAPEYRIKPDFIFRRSARQPRIPYCCHTNDAEQRTRYGHSLTAPRGARRSDISDGRSRSSGGPFVQGSPAGCAAASRARNREHGAVLQPTGAGTRLSLLRPPLVLETVSSAVGSPLRHYQDREPDQLPVRGIRRRLGFDPPTLRLYDPACRQALRSVAITPNERLNMTIPNLLCEGRVDPSGTAPASYGDPGPDAFGARAIGRRACSDGLRASFGIPNRDGPSGTRIAPDRAPRRTRAFIGVPVQLNEPATDRPT